MAGGAYSPRRPQAAPRKILHEAAGGMGLEFMSLSAGASHASAASSANLAFEPAPLGMAAMRMVQSLQEKLRHTQRQLRDAERAAKGLQATVEDRGVQSDTFACRQDQFFSTLQKAQQEHWQELQLEESLTAQIEQCQGELAAARRRRELLVPPAEHEELRQELDRTLNQVSEAEDEGRELQRRLAEAEAAQRRRDRRFTLLAKEELERRRSPRNPREVMQSKAAELSARVAAESQRRHRAKSQERAVHLDGKREQLSQELHRLSRENVVLEQRLDALRARNRQLETLQRRAAQAGSEQEDELRAELRRRAMPLRVLSDLVRDSDGDCNNDLAATAPCSAMAHLEVDSPYRHDGCGFSELRGIGG